VIEKYDRRQVRRQPARGIAAEHGHQLRAERLRRHVRRHQAPERIVCADRDHRPHRLRHGSFRELRQCAGHRLDEIVDREHRFDIFFSQETESDRHIEFLRTLRLGCYSSTA